MLFFLISGILPADLVLSGAFRNLRASEKNYFIVDVFFERFFEDKIAPMAQQRKAKVHRLDCE